MARARVRPGELVLDLGAGAGALTGPLVAAGARVIAVELHPGRAAALRSRFPDVTVVERDLRTFRFPSRPFRVVASPPYPLTSELVRSLLRADGLRGADLVLQRGAARRLVERQPRSRRPRLELRMPVPRRAFRPPPRVDSVVLGIKPR